LKYITQETVMAMMVELAKKGINNHLLCEFILKCKFGCRVTNLKMQIQRIHIKLCKILGYKNSSIKSNKIDIKTNKNEV
jgi:hypothetical protein